MITMSNQIEIRHIRYFLAVATELHFRKAAETLFISQPGLTRQIKQMEDSLGYQLFERNNKSVQLTDTGVYLKNELELMLNNLEKTFAHGKLIDEGVLGHLKIGYVGSAMQKIIPDLLVKLRAKNAQIQFDIEEMYNHVQIENLLNQQIDVGFVRLNRVPKGLEMIKVLEENFVLVLPYDHPINEANFVDLSQFKDESFIFFKPSFSQGYFETITQIFDDYNFYPKIVHNSVNANTIFNLVAHNFGVSIIPKSLQADYSNAIKFIELKNISQRTILSLVYNKQNRNPLLYTVLEFFK